MNQSKSESANTARREFLKFLAASPYVAALGGVTVFLERSGLALAQNGRPASEVIGSPAEALNVFDFEEPAHRKVQPGHWAYMASGVDDDATLRANREGFKHIELRPRRLRDATKVDMHVELFGTTYNSPIFTCPTGGEKSFFPEGELAVARAAKAHGTLQVLSTMTSVAVEDVNKELGRPVWQQIYAPSTWDACRKLLQRVQDSGVSVIALTVDNTTGRNSETFLRTRPKDLSQCKTCHEDGAGPSMKERPMFNGIDMTGVRAPSPAMDWAFADQIRKFWKGKFLIKGVDTREDTKMCIEHGIDGILVSNHGGRSMDYGPSSLEVLPEIVAAVNGRIPVLFDSGIRRGADIFKALALGANGVQIGRTARWGLAAYGTAGAQRLIEILQQELVQVAASVGCAKLSDINKTTVKADFV